MSRKRTTAKKGYGQTKAATESQPEAKPIKIGKVKPTSDPVWDLYKDGITQSALKLFLTCPEQFRIRVVEGWRSTGQRKPLILGSMFHGSLDIVMHNYTQDFLASAGLEESFKVSAQAVNEYCRTEKPHYLLPHYSEIWSEVEGLVPILLQNYLSRWTLIDEEAKLLCVEKTFDVEYRGIRLRGKWDQLRQTDGIWVFDVKLKGRINPNDIKDNLYRDFQLMFYSTVARMTYRRYVEGFLHDIVRIPGLRQKVDESNGDFLVRIHQDIIERPEHYYMRFANYLPPAAVDTWRKCTLDPILDRLEKWWDAFSPEKPFDDPYHYENSSELVGPWGPCDTFDIQVHNNYTHYRKSRIVFPELLQKVSYRVS